MEAVLENFSNFSNTTSNQGLQNPGFAVFLVGAISIVQSELCKLLIVCMLLFIG